MGFGNWLTNKARKVKFQPKGKSQHFLDSKKANATRNSIGLRMTHGKDNDTSLPTLHALRVESQGLQMILDNPPSRQAFDKAYNRMLEIDRIVKAGKYRRI